MTDVASWLNLSSCVLLRFLVFSFDPSSTLRLSWKSYQSPWRSLPYSNSPRWDPSWSNLWGCPCALASFSFSYLPATAGRRIIQARYACPLKLPSLLLSSLHLQSFLLPSNIFQLLISFYRFLSFHWPQMERLSCSAWSLRLRGICLVWLPWSFSLGLWWTVLHLWVTGSHLQILILNFLLSVHQLMH